MPVLTFPFVSLKPGDEPRPYLPVTIVNPQSGMRMESYALVDTGADECAFPARFADILGHTLSAGRPKQVRTGNGISMAYSHTTRIELDEYRTGPVSVDYLPNLDTPLLGVQSFLANFVVTIDYPGQIVSPEFAGAA